MLSSPHTGDVWNLSTVDGTRFRHTESRNSEDTSVSAAPYLEHSTMSMKDGVKYHFVLILRGLCSRYISFIYYFRELFLLALRPISSAGVIPPVFSCASLPSSSIPRRFATILAISLSATGSLY